MSLPKRLIARHSKSSHECLTHSQPYPTKHRYNSNGEVGLKCGPYWCHVCPLKTYQLQCRRRAYARNQRKSLGPNPLTMYVLNHVGHQPSRYPAPFALCPIAKSLLVTCTCQTVCCTRRRCDRGIKFPSSEANLLPRVTVRLHRPSDEREGGVVIYAYVACEPWSSTAFAEMISDSSLPL